MRAIFSPFIVLAQINGLKLQLLAPELQTIRLEMMDAYCLHDKNKINQADTSMQLIKLKYNINTRYNAVPLLQLPFILFFFWTLQEMSKEIILYPKMTTEGFLWFTNLSVADPFFLLPIGLAVASSWSMHKSPAFSQTGTPAAVYANYFKFLPFLGIPVTSMFSSAVVLNWFIMSILQGTINTVIYSKKGKKIFGIPQYLPGSILEKFNNNVRSKENFSKKH